MGTAGTYTPEKLVLAILSPLPGAGEEVAAAAASSWGPVDLRAGPLPFTWSHYYDSEMGAPLLRSFLSFERLVDPSALAAIKEETNTLEARWTRDGRRSVNIDPGLLAVSRFTLASTKDTAHRVPLSRGIYAELTLLFAGGGFHALEWTYPDYRSEEYQAVLRQIRAVYKEQLRAAGRR
jgi:hypothetical protein